MTATDASPSAEASPARVVEMPTVAPAWGAAGSNVEGLSGARTLQNSEGVNSSLSADSRPRSATGFREPRCYCGGKPGKSRLRRLHYVCGRRCTDDGQRHDGLIHACPPLSRPKTPDSDSSQIRFDDSVSVVFDFGPVRPVSGEQGAFHVLMNGGHLRVAARRWPSAVRGEPSGERRRSLLES